MSFSSSAGDLKVSAYDQISLKTQSSTGTVRIDSSVLTLTALGSSTATEAQQVCICGDGNLYTVPAGALCNSVPCV